LKAWPPAVDITIAASAGGLAAVVCPIVLFIPAPKPVKERLGAAAGGDLSH